MTNDILTADLKEYVDSIIGHFEELGIPASITVFIETDKKIIQTSSVRRSDFNSVIINTVIRNIKLLADNTAFLHVLQRAIETK